MIEAASFALHWYVVEVDCASISGLRELIAVAEEATQSHSVGGLFERGGGDIGDGGVSMTSMVVLEHVDALIARREQATKSFLDLILRSKVPLVMTAYENTFVRDSERRVEVIRCALFDKPIKILSSALWFQSLSRNEMEKMERLLLFTDRDIRRTALQFQVKPDAEDLVSGDVRFYLGMGKRVFREETERGRREVYSRLADLLLAVDQYEGVFENYFDEITENCWDREREREIGDYMKFVRNRLQMQAVPMNELVEISSLIFESCKNPIQKTRRSLAITLQGNVNLTTDEILSIQKLNFGFA